jgi:hypothetical protein
MLMLAKPYAHYGKVHVPRRACMEKIETWRKATVVSDEGRSEQLVINLTYVNATTVYVHVDMLEQDTYRIHLEYLLKDPLLYEFVSVTFCMRALAIRGRNTAAADAYCESSFPATIAPVPLIEQAARSCTMPPYVYEPLRKGHIRHKQCIRLVELLPGSENDKIRIHINRASVEGHSYPVYEALSYCWGDASNPCEIEVVSQGIFHRSKRRKEGFDHTTLRITANLASALIHLRRQDAARVLWIDAICLDQDNEEEKALELAKMGDIYAEAKSVVIWLGPGSDETAEAFRAMSYLGRQVQWIPGKNELVTGKDCDEAWKNWKDQSFIVPFDYRTWLAIEEVILSQWFRRVWIWQEICLADHEYAILQCGASFMPWRTFLNAIAFFDTDPDSGPTGLKESFNTSLREVANLTLIQPSRHLLGLLGVTRRCDCKYPEDRIYGVCTVILLISIFLLPLCKRFKSFPRCIDLLRPYRTSHC